MVISLIFGNGKMKKSPLFYIKSWEPKTQHVLSCYGVFQNAIEKVDFFSPYQKRNSKE